MTLPFCCIYRDNVSESPKDCNYPAWSPAKGFWDPVYAFLKRRETYANNKHRGSFTHARHQNDGITTLLQTRTFWTGDIERPFCGVSCYLLGWFVLTIPPKSWVTSWLDFSFIHWSIYYVLEARSWQEGTSYFRALRLYLALYIKKRFICRLFNTSRNYIIVKCIW